LEKTLASAISQEKNFRMMISHAQSERLNSMSGRLNITEKLGFGIKCCEVALSSASTRAWEDKIKNARKVHRTALRFVHRFNVSGHDPYRINQRVTHLRTLLDELR
jgi:hypothetical protein